MNNLFAKQSLLIASVVLGNFVVGFTSSARADAVQLGSLTTNRSAVALSSKSKRLGQVTNEVLEYPDTIRSSVESESVEPESVEPELDISRQAVDIGAESRSHLDLATGQPLENQPLKTNEPRAVASSTVVTPATVVTPEKYPRSLDSVELLRGNSTLAQDLSLAETTSGVPQPSGFDRPTQQTALESPASDPTSDAAVVNPLAPSPDWKFDFEPYVFIPFRVHGDLFFGRDRDLLLPNRPGIILPTSEVNVSVDQSLSDLTENLTNLFGLSGRFQAWKGNLGIITDGLYVTSKFSNNAGGDTLTLRDRFDIEIPDIDIDAKNTMASFSIAGSYRLFNTPLGTVKDPSNPNDYYPAFSMEVLAGVRYLYFFQSLDLDPGPDFEVSTSEVKPMLGGTIKLMFSQNFGLYFRGDTSAFGDDNLQQFYNLYAGVDWKPSRDFSIRVAYRLNHIEYVKEGRRGGENGVDLSSEGVNLGVAWQF